jgi:hypothetical protein
VLYTFVTLIPPCVTHSSPSSRRALRFRHSDSAVRCAFVTLAPLCVTRCLLVAHLLYVIIHWLISGVEPEPEDADGVSLSPSTSLTCAGSLMDASI